MERVRQAAISLPNQFDATPGTYKLAVVLSAGGDAFGKFESPLAIDPYDGKHFSLSGVALTNSPQRLDDIPTGLDSVLLEDRTPLVVKGLQIVPSGSNRFKHTDNVILYTEIYEPLLTSPTPPVVGMAYPHFRAIDQQASIFPEVVRADDFIQKGNSRDPHRNESESRRPETRFLPLGDAGRRQREESCAGPKRGFDVTE